MSKLEPYSFESSQNKTRERFINTLLAKPTNPPPLEADRKKFYNEGISPSGLPAIVRQKILVVNDSDNLLNNDQITLHYQENGTPKSLLGKVKRVSEYLNDLREFPKLITRTVLIEWSEASSPEFIATIISLDKRGQLIVPVAQNDQIDNFIISPTPPNSDPDPPIRSGYLAPGILSDFVAKSDYSQDAYRIIDQISDTPESPSSDIKVVISDTGLKYNLDTAVSPFPNGGQFPIAVNPNHLTNGDPNRIGFCSITNYLDDTYLSSSDPSHIRQRSFPPPGIPSEDDMVLKNPHDDHPARHGTFVTAIVSQNTLGHSKVIPLKIFDFLGFGTYFDILCGFNYIFSRLQAGENIRVVNASWGAGVSQKNSSVFLLLEKKIAVLEAEKVFVIAAAGNRKNIREKVGNDLKNFQIFPACYSKNYSNVITVTSVAERWRKRLLNFNKVSNYVNKALCERLFETDRPLVRLLNSISTIVPDGYQAVENFSEEYVNVGVVAHPMGGFFPTPFIGDRNLPIAGSSFATPFMAAYVVNFLEKNPTLAAQECLLTRQAILNSLSTHDSLKNSIKDGRFLELSTVMGKSINEIFRTVIDAILR